MTLVWPENAGEYPQSIELDEKDKKDVEAISFQLNKNNILSSLGVTASVHNDDTIWLKDNNNCFVEVFFKKNKRRLFDKYFFVLSTMHYTSKEYGNRQVNSFAFGSKGGHADMPEITLFRDMPKHLVLNIVIFISLIQNNPIYLDHHAKHEIFLQTGFGGY